LFDAIAAIIGITHTITYDGQAAIELENIAESDIQQGYPYHIACKQGVYSIDYKHFIQGVMEDVLSNKAHSIISAKFHNTLAYASCALACKLRQTEGINTIVLSGGVFENDYLLKKLYDCLTLEGFEVFYNHQIPINDGGISFGQLNIANAIFENGSR
jgi:hydrogenase maturation protein HypF